MIRIRRDAAEGSGVTTVWIHPNRALSRRGMWILGAVLVIVPWLGAVLGAMAGNVYAPAFALGQTLIVVPALIMVWRGGERGERIRVDGDMLEVEAFPGRLLARFQSGWVRVLLQPGRDRRRLLLASHGRELEIGAFLADPEREALRDKLTLVLRGLRAPRA